MTARDPRPLAPVEQVEAPLSDASLKELEHRRLINRASLSYLLDIIVISRDGRHPIDALLLSTIIQANVAQVSARADLQISTAALDTPPTDDMRRPVSINALASSLRLPFETVRRRVHGLKTAGFCRVDAAGVVVPTAVLMSEPYLRQAFVAYERLRALHAELDDLGALADMPEPTVQHAGGFLPLRAAARVATDYVLRAMDVAHDQFGDLFTALMLMEITRSNTEHLRDAIDTSAMLDARGVLLDVHRRPVRATQVAARVGLPMETVRRYILDLMRQGLIHRTPQGLLAPADALVRPEVVRFTQENVVHLRRMFAALSQLGVLAVWSELRRAQA